VNRPPGAKQRIDLVGRRLKIAQQDYEVRYAKAKRRFGGVA
jgi:hypothetical protein